MMKAQCSLFWILGVILTLYGLVSAFTAMNVFWYGIFVVGLTFLFGSINLWLGNKTVFSKSSPYILKLYLIYFAVGLLIEVIGRLMLNLWYAHESLTFQIQVFEVFLIVYPFVLFSVYELFVFLKSYLKSNVAAFISTWLLYAFISELPNTFVYEWVYTIPYITLEIMHINIAVIISWAVLVAVPLAAQKIIRLILHNP